MLKFTQVKTCQLADLLQAVNQRVSVNEELSGGLGHVEVVLEEALNGHQRFTVKGLQTSSLEYLLQEHLAERGGKLIDQAADAEIFIADDILSVSNTLPTSSATCASL